MMEDREAADALLGVGGVGGAARFGAGRGQ